MTTKEALGFLMSELTALEAYRVSIGDVLEKRAREHNEFGLDCLQHLSNQPDRLERLMEIYDDFSLMSYNKFLTLTSEQQGWNTTVFEGRFTELDTFLAEQEKGAKDEAE